MNRVRKEPILSLRKVKLFSELTAIASISTLICCALPAFLILMGAGSVLSVFISFFPQFPMISQYKIEIFTISLIIILFAGVGQMYAKTLPCPTDKDQSLSCSKIRKRSFQLFIASIILYITGFYFAFLI